MLNALIWGLVSTSSLVLGGVLGIWIPFGKKTMGMIMAFGAGVLISALSYELIFSAVKLSMGTGFAAFGFLTGAFIFFFSDRIIGNMGASNRKSIGSTHKSSIVIPLVLGIILDGVPESMVIGLGILEEGTVSFAMLLAVFISNLPESIAGTVGMRNGGWTKAKILLLWLLIAVVCAGCTVLGFALFADVDPGWLSFVQAFAGGAILMMLANTMIPEAYEHGGKLAGVFTVLGFGIAVVVVLMENTPS